MENRRDSAAGADSKSASFSNKGTTRKGLGTLHSLCKSSTMRTSDGDVAMEITYAPKQSGGSSAIKRNVSNTSLTSSVIFRSAPKRGRLPRSSDRTHSCQCQLTIVNRLDSRFGCCNTHIIPKVSNQKQGASQPTTIPKFAAQSSGNMKIANMAK